MENSEMTEREMLEFAAKAYGFGSDSGGFVWTESEYPRGSITNGALWNYKGWRDTAELWNPLADDGDALRLAAALRIDITNLKDRVSAACDDSFYSVSTPDGSDRAAGIRLAITKAAAAAGKRVA